MNGLLLVITFISAGVVLVHGICVASRLSRQGWYGHPLLFFGISASYALVCGGSVGIVLGWTPGPMLLLLGVAGWVIFDRRIRVF